MGEMKAAMGGPVEHTGNNGLCLYIEKSSFEPRVSFLDYIFGGLELTVNVAIDYTISNGHQRSHDSLHDFNLQSSGECMNEYTQAIGAVMNIIQDYASD
jgi:hypothetical protein